MKNICQKSCYALIKTFLGFKTTIKSIHKGGSGQLVSNFDFVEGYRWYKVVGWKTIELLVRIYTFGPSPWPGNSWELNRGKLTRNIKYELGLG